MIITIVTEHLLWTRPSFKDCECHSSQLPSEPRFSTLRRREVEVQKLSDFAKLPQQGVGQWGLSLGTCTPELMLLACSWLSQVEWLPGEEGLDLS